MEITRILPSPLLKSWAPQPVTNKTLFLERLSCEFPVSGNERATVEPFGVLESGDCAGLRISATNVQRYFRLLVRVPGDVTSDTMLVLRARLRSTATLTATVALAYRDAQKGWTYCKGQTKEINLSPLWSEVALAMSPKDVPANSPVVLILHLKNDCELELAELSIVRGSIAEIRELLPASEKPPTAPPTTGTHGPAHSVEGRVERANAQGVRGWAWDSSLPEERLEVELLDNGVPFDRCVANMYRADLEKAGKAKGNCGFRTSLPSHMFDGRKHSITARIYGRSIPLTPRPIIFQSDLERPYKNWEEFQRWAIHHRQFFYPLLEEDKRVMGFMDGMLRMLRARFLSRPQQRLVSVVMPVYNRAALVGDAIQSVLRQSYRNWELLVVDDGSTDETRNVVHGVADPRVRVIELGTNRGVSAARNHALRQVNGDVIAYLDSDNSWHEDFLLVMTNALSDEPDRISAYCAQEVTEQFENRGNSSEQKSLRYGPFHRALLENRNYIDLNAFVHTREAFERYGGFNEELRRLVDWDLILRYTADAAPKAVPCLLSYYFHGRASNQITVNADGTEELVAAQQEKTAFLLPFGAPSVVDDEPHPSYRFYGPPARRPASVEDRKASVIIVSYEAAQYLEYCIQSLYEFTSAQRFDLIIVDNGSAEAVHRVLDQVAKRPNVCTIRNETNTGFTFAVNQGIQAADPHSDVVLLNNDSLVTPGWLDALQEPKGVVPNLGIVVPRQTLLPRADTLRTHAPFARPTRETDVNISAHHDNVLDTETWSASGFVELTFAPFFCAYITRECLGEVGLLDAENGRHYRSDRLYCDMVRGFAKRRIIYTPHAKLYHFLQQSTKALQQSDRGAFQTMFVDNTWQNGEFERVSRVLGPPITRKSRSS